MSVVGVKRERENTYEIAVRKIASIFHQSSLTKEIEAVPKTSQLWKIYETLRRDSLGDLILELNSGNLDSLLSTDILNTCKAEMKEFNLNFAEPPTTTFLEVMIQKLETGRAKKDYKVLNSNSWQKCAVNLLMKSRFTWNIDYVALAKVKYNSLVNTSDPSKFYNVCNGDTKFIHFLTANASDKCIIMFKDYCDILFEVCKYLNSPDDKLNSSFDLESGVLQFTFPPELLSKLGRPNRSPNVAVKNAQQSVRTGVAPRVSPQAPRKIQQMSSAVLPST